MNLVLSSTAPRSKAILAASSNPVTAAGLATKEGNSAASAIKSEADVGEVYTRPATPPLRVCEKDSNFKLTIPE